MVKRRPMTLGNGDGEGKMSGIGWPWNANANAVDWRQAGNMEKMNGGKSEEKARREMERCRDGGKLCFCFDA